MEYALLLLIIPEHSEIIYTITNYEWKILSNQIVFIRMDKLDIIRHNKISDSVR